MALVYSMKPIGKLIEQRDIELMFKSNAAFKINSASGPFRIFITKLVKTDGGFQYIGTVADNTVEGFYNPMEEKGTIIFQPKPKPALVAR